MLNVAHVPQTFRGRLLTSFTEFPKNVNLCISVGQNLKLKIFFCFKQQNSTDKAPFEWTVSVESSIDSSYFAGYLITQVPGGFLASMYPANKIFGVAIVTSAIFNMAIPGAMSVGPAAVVILKVAQGFVEASEVTFESIFCAIYYSINLKTL